MTRCSAICGDVFAEHDIETHTESGARIRQVLGGAPAGITWREPRKASRRDLERVHHPGYLRWLQEISSGAHFIDPNTYVTAHSFEVAACAAGSAIAAVERAMDGEHCFALVRPPGHHAEADQAMGFCLLNNAAIAAANALTSVERVAIVDWDLHHGNGTQNIFYGSDRVLYCSVHQEGAFPRTGWVDEIGSGSGRGYSLNVPLKKGATISDYRAVFTELFVPALERFRPDLLIVSAGQDPLADDRHGSMCLQPADFGVLTRILMGASDLPLALVLEGGYGPSHGAAVSHIFQALQGKRIAGGEAGEPRRSTRALIGTLKKVWF
ncbi:MAG: histone deacetylase [Methanomicrobiales archaeon]|nr:histone deacetylase [Methanomicrobiales archaeon]